MRVNRIVLLICAALWVWSAFVQSQEADAGEDSAQQEQQVSPSAESPEVGEMPLPIESSDAFEDFDPSEEISEDLSVPFPVDI